LLITRVLTAAVLLAAFFAAALLLDRGLFALVACAVMAAGAFEWGRLAGLAPVQANVYAGVCILIFAALFFTPPWYVTGAFAALFWVAVVPFWLARGIPASRPGLLAAGAVVLVPAGVAMAALPPVLMLLSMGLVWIADSAAYFAGRAFGRRKLAPKISPGKTWEGAAGGAAGCLIYAIICAMLNPDLGGRIQGWIWVPYLAGAALLCAISIVGDLFESALKRQAGAKDSGTLLPGHGGVLDRIDSATAVLPLALLMLGLARIA
jgi:phosphatidate cytidylyltransferase